MLPLGRNARAHSDGVTRAPWIHRHQLGDVAMKKNIFFSSLPVLAALGFSAPAFTASKELEEAVALVKQMHGDQCEQRHLRGEMLLAHQTHDQEKMDVLGPRLEAVNQRLQPSEDRLKALRLSIRKNSGEQGALDVAVLEAGSCD